MRKSIPPATRNAPPAMNPPVEIVAWFVAVCSSDAARGALAQVGAS